MELLNYKIIGTYSALKSPDVVFFIKLPDFKGLISHLNKKKKGVSNGKLSEIQKDKGKKGISKKAPEGA